MDRQAYVYIMSNRRQGTLYFGISSRLSKRVWQHKSANVPGFSQKYRTTLLVYYEPVDSMYAAILRERQIKKWPRQQKIALIEAMNPQWADLYEGLLATTSADEQPPSP